MAIYLGYSDADKRCIIAEYQAAHGIRKTVVISHEHYPLPIPETDQITYADVIRYVVFYRLLQEIDTQTLIVINECLRTQNRYDLTYNCIRNYLNQTSHVLVFQMLPQIDMAEDFMILFDFATGSRWKRQHFDASLILDNAELHIRAWPVAFEAIPVPTSAATKCKYAETREAAFAELGARDPHILPRQLYLIGGKDKLAYISNHGQQQPTLFGDQPEMAQWYVARNKRMGHERIVTYDHVQPGTAYTVVELPHRFIDYSDFVCQTGQACSRVLVTDLKVDHWYYDRYTAWGNRIHETYASLRQANGT